MTSSSRTLTTSVSDSNDHLTSDSSLLSSNQHQYPIEISSSLVMPRLIPIEDDEAARMDAEQTPERVPVGLPDVTIPNDNAVFVIEELVTMNKSAQTLPKSLEQQSHISDTVSCDVNTSLDMQNDHESITKLELNSHGQSQ
jgi:hypothetical protein